MVEYEQGDDLNREAWTSVKFTLGMDFPNLPYFIDGDFKMSETMPIHQFIADKWMPELLGKDAQTRATVNMIANVIGDLKNAVTRPCYTTGNIEEITGKMEEMLPKIVGFLGNNKFLTGDAVTWVDFYFVEVVELMSKHSADLFTKYPTLKTY